MPFSVYVLLCCMHPWRDATGGRPRAVTVVTGVVMAAAITAVIMRPVMMAVGGAKTATRLPAGCVSRFDVMLEEKPASDYCVAFGCKGGSP